MNVTKTEFSLYPGIETYYNNEILKYGRIVTYRLQTEEYTITELPCVHIATVPVGFRPMTSIIGNIPRKGDSVPIVYNIYSTGNVTVYGTIDNQQIVLSGAYITDQY